MKKLMAVFTLLFASAAVFLLSVFSASAAETEITAGAFTISGEDITENTDYTYAGNVLTILSSKEVTISGTTTTDRIVVDSTEGANITLKDVSVTSSGAAFNIVESTTGTVTVTLAGENNLKSGGNNAGLQKTSTDCELIIQGDGKLVATATGMGAGIGGRGVSPGTGSKGGDGVNITIRGGTINATGGAGAGIGGGYSGDSKDITISGGTVTATSYSGAGIGGGSSNEDGRFGSKAENITISGGVVTATSNSGAGIGAGQDDSGIAAHAKNITISGGTVTAISTSGRKVGIGSMVNPAELDADKDTVYIKGDETHCPIVYANGIYSCNNSIY